MVLGWIFAGVLLLFLLYAWHVNRAIAGTPPDAAKFLSPNWTEEQIREAYRKTKESPTDVKKFLPPKQGRRYIVCGGSGLVGGWIVNHLLLRGEDPAAIRIIDLSRPQRPEVYENNVQFISTDITDPAAVDSAFKASWKNSRIEKLPLTVFYCIAYINVAYRHEEFLAPYWKVNVEGTRNALNAARAVGASCMVVTSSGSVGMTYPQFLLPPWKRWPKNIFQILRNAEVKDYDAPLESYGTCYAYTKVKAEKLIRDADDPKNGFRTGVIRPGHAIYGHGVENSSSVTFDYLRRGSSSTWLPNMVSHFVSAQNVSIAHLAFEDCLVGSGMSNTRRKRIDVGGRAYAVTDPGGAMLYLNLYNTLRILAHPLTPINFPIVAPAPMLFLGYFVETYARIRNRYARFLPPITGDVATLGPALFNVCTLHLFYDDSLAKEEIGYNPPITSLEGFCMQLVDWNDKVEKKMRDKVSKGEGGDVKVNKVPDAAVPAVKM